jgi:hypothetical protein
LAGKSAHVFGVQLFLPLPHVLNVPPPPHVSGALQVPHWTTSPQPLPVGPHETLRSAHVRAHAPPPPPLDDDDDAPPSGLMFPTMLPGGAPDELPPASGGSSTKWLSPSDPHAASASTAPKRHPPARCQETRAIVALPRAIRNTGHVAAVS